MTDWTLEAAKLIVQAALVLGAAWLAVSLALRRYKKERLWDRKIQALADVLASLSAMEYVSKLWLEEEWEPEHQPINSTAREERANRYREARWKLREAKSVAQMLWPEDVNAILSELEERIDSAAALAEHTGDYGEASQTEQNAIEEAVRRLVEIGKRHARA